jgi:predicted nucleic acid-binding protein
MSVSIRYLLDTSVLIDYSKAYEPAKTLVEQLLQSPYDVGVCSVVVAEFKSGIPTSDHESWDELLHTLEYWDISYRAASRAGAYRYALARQGRAMLTPDALIAGLASDRGAVLVTNNANGFPMSDISLLIP